MSKFRATYSNGPRTSAEFIANSGSMASGAESSDITVTHNLGVAAFTVVGHVEDGAWSHHVGWRKVSGSSTQVVIKFRNNGPNTAQAFLHFRLVY